MTLTPEMHLWACALWVEKNHGVAGVAYIGRQVERLAIQGDQEGVATWRAIAERLDLLQREEGRTERERLVN